MEGQSEEQMREEILRFADQIREKAREEEAEKRPQLLPVAESAAEADGTDLEGSAGVTV